MAVAPTNTNPTQPYYPPGGTTVVTQTGTYYPDGSASMNPSQRQKAEEIRLRQNFLRDVQAALNEAGIYLKPGEPIPTEILVKVLRNGWTEADLNKHLPPTNKPNVPTPTPPARTTGTSTFKPAWLLIPAALILLYFLMR